MPYELHIPLQTASMIRPRLPEQRALHGFIFDAFEAADPALSRTIHEQHSKPFTQALFAGDDDRLQWRITLLDDTLYEPLMCGLRQLPAERLQERMNIHDAALHLQALRLYQETYYALAEGSTLERYPLSFRTPTTFSQSTHHHPIPDPYLCWQSWWTRWTAFAPSDLAINIALLDIISAHAVVTRFRIKSRFWRDGPIRLIGAVGEMTFVSLRTDEIDDHWWRHAAWLASYARFCGTGYKTAQGFGQTQLNNSNLNKQR